MDAIKVALHIFLVVLILGTGWRLVSLHLIDATNPHLQHLGRGMAFQYGG